MVSLVMTSEEKLLQLIRGIKSKKPDGAFQGAWSQRHWLGLNRLLAAAIVVLAAVLIWRYQALRREYTVQAAQEASRKPGLQSAPAAGPAVEYTDSFENVRGVFGSRNIFQPAQAQETADTVQIPEEQPRMDFSQMYRIAGIVLGDEPMAIVENIQSSTTVFLTVGDSLDNAVVKEIQQDRVILEIDGKIVELKS